MPTLNNVLYGLLNTYTGESQTFTKVTTWIDGSTMDDSKCDGTIFRKKGSEYFKLNYTGPVNIKWFGAKGDGATDDTPAFQRFIDAFAGVGETALLEHGTFLVKDLVVPTGYRFMSNQKPANNSYAFVNATVKPAAGAQYIFIFPGTTRYAVLENLNINGDYENHPDLLAAISFTGAYSKLLGNNITGCAQACVIMPEATTCTIKDNFMGGWFGPAPVFNDTNDFRGTLQIEVCGDSYIVDNEFSASLPYFTSYPDPSDILRDKVNGRICAMAVRTYFGNSVCTGNIFENGDRGVVLAGCVYSYFGGNRYELSGMGNLYIRGSMYNTTFLGERFADGSLAGDGVYDDIELATGAVGNVSFVSPTFLILTNGVIPASSFKVRYNLTNYASLEIAWIEPVYNASYVAGGYINPNLPAFPVRELVGQYHPQNPVYKSSLTIGSRLANDSLDTETTGYVKIDAGTTVANQDRTGIVGWYKANDLRVSAIGFDNADNAMSFALTNPGVYSFSNGGLFAAKAGGTYLNLQSNDGQGTCAINLYADPSQTHVGLISLNAETAQFNVIASGQMLFQSPGFTYIGGDVNIAKQGGVSLGLLCSDSTGTSMFRISSDPLATHEFRISMNNATGVTRLISGDDIIIGGTGDGNIKIQSNGLTFIPQAPSPGTTSNSYLLGRKTTTGELTIIDPTAGMAPASGGAGYIQNQASTQQSANFYINGIGTLPIVSGGTNVSDTLTLLNYGSSINGVLIDQYGVNIGGGSTSNNTLLKTKRTFANISANVHGCRSEPSAYMTTGPYNGGILGGFFVPAISALNTQNWAGGVAIQGISVAPTINSGATGIMDFIVGGTFALNFAASGVTVKNAVGIRVYIDPAAVSTITNTIFLLIAHSAPPPLGNWSIYNASSYNNYLGSGNLLLNTTSDNGLGAKLQVAGLTSMTATTEQLRIRYNASNYLSVTTASTGSTTFSLSGTSPAFTFNQLSYFNGGIATSSIRFDQGSDAAGDIYYRNSIGFLTRLGVGSPGNILAVDSAGLPSWASVALPAASPGTPTFNSNANTSDIIGSGYSVTITGNGNYMKISITTGTGINTTGTIGNIVLSTAFTSTPIVVYSASDLNAIGTTVGFSGVSTVNISIFNKTQLANSTTYTWNIIAGH